MRRGAGLQPSPADDGDDERGASAATIQSGGMEAESLCYGGKSADLLHETRMNDGASPRERYNHARAQDMCSQGKRKTDDRDGIQV